MIFWDDLWSKQRDIAKLIEILKKYKINAESNVNIVTADDQQYCAVIDKRIKVVIGNVAHFGTENLLFESGNTRIFST